MLTYSPAFSSLSSVGSLLLNNSEFRFFLGDLTTISREVFRDTAFSLSAVSKEVGKEVAPSEGNGHAGRCHHHDTQHPPSSHDFKEGAAEVTSAVSGGVGKVAKDASASVADNVSQEERETLLARLKQTVLGLRQKPNYNESVSALSILLRRCIKAYTRTLSKAAESLEEDVHRNRETDLALYNFWKFVTSIGDKERWEELEDAFKAMLGNAKDDPHFEQHLDQVGDLLQAMLTDPGFYDNSKDRFAELYDKLRLKGAPGFRRDIDVFLSKLRLACSSAWQDDDIQRITDTAKNVSSLLQKSSARDLTSDCMNVLAPTLIDAIQYIPIPRLELASPTLDLLLENLILEPGKTTNRSSFFPHRVGFTTKNDVEILKGRVNTTSRMRTFARLSLSGISVSTLDVGCWLRYHSGILRFGGEGLVSLELDQRGIDVILDLEIGRDRIDELLTVRNVHVKVHKFNYELRQTGLSWLTWLLKPLLRPVLKKVVEARLASAIKNTCATVNRELLFARERLRAARVASPNDVWTFVRAVAARLGSKQDADQYLRIGVDEPGRGVFEGVYAPGSLVRVWNEEGRRAGEHTRQLRRDGWRNAIFNI